MIQKFRIATKMTGLNIAIFALLSLTIVYIGNLLLDSEGLKREATDRQEVNLRVAWSILDQLSSDFYIQDNKLYAGSNVLNNNNQLVDKIKDLVGGTATIFMGDTRVATNVIKDDGTRAIGTRLAQGPVYDAIFKEGKPYRGEADILGKSYITAYDPIKDEKGDVIGILYVGIDKDKFFAPVEQVISRIIFIVICFGFLLCGVNYLLARKFVSIPLEQACSVIKAMSKGNLTIDLHDTQGDEISELYNSFHRMQMLLTDVIHGIRIGAYEVAQSSEQVAKGNTDLSQRTQEQASSLEEIASSMEQMTSTVNQTADNALHANKLSVAAREQAEKGGEVTGRAVNAMDTITASSKKIAEIINVIDEIAFQTNLLALNASVEAARAGEQGRGFAVVAGEVRSLAGRCKTAAQEIKELIKDSVDKVQDGTKLVNDSKSSLDEIILSVKKVSDIVAEIAAASQEQADGIKQVNTSILQMDEMTQQNASLVEEAAASSESMGAQADELNTLVKYFKLNESEQKLQDSNKTKHRKLLADEAATHKHTAQPTLTQAKPLPKTLKKVDSDDSEWEEF